MNKYYELLEKIIRDFRSSSYEMEKFYRIKGFSVKMSELKKNPNRKLTQKSLADIESALKIKIDDSDPNNITYTKAEKAVDLLIPKGLKPLSEDDFVKVPIHGHVHAGVDSPIFSEDVIETLLIPKNLIPYKDLHGVVVVGDRMEPIITAGDHAIVSLSTKPQSGDVCLVAFDDNDYVLKRVYFNKNAGFTILVSDNKKYAPITVLDQKIKSILPVVDLHKKRENLRFHI